MKLGSTIEARPEPSACDDSGERDAGVSACPIVPSPEVSRAPTEEGEPICSRGRTFSGSAVTIILVAKCWGTLGKHPLC